MTRAPNDPDMGAPASIDEMFVNMLNAKKNDELTVIQVHLRIELEQDVFMLRLLIFSLIRIHSLGDLCASYPTDYDRVQSPTRKYPTADITIFPRLVSLPAGRAGCGRRQRRTHLFCHFRLDPGTTSTCSDGRRRS